MTKQQAMRHKHKRIILTSLIVGLVGVWLMVGAWAARDPDTPAGPRFANPSFKNTCGLDFVIAIDSSDSIDNAKHARFGTIAKAFVDKLAGTNTQFAVVKAASSGGGLEQPLTKNIQSTKAAINKIIAEGTTGGDASEMTTASRLNSDRSNKQNIYFLLSDGGPDTGNDGDDAKKAGMRLLNFYDSDRGGPQSNNISDFGARIDTGNILTTDIFTSASDYTKLATQLGDFVRYQSCGLNPPGGGGGGGTGGNGNGTGGSSKGTGTNGSGTGKKGSGSGGGGSSADKQSDKPKPTPAPSPQGTKTEEPKNQEPSPFFDGKQYSIGSDPDAQTPGDLVANPGKAFLNWWFYPIAAVSLIGIGFGGWFGWKKLNTTNHSKPGSKK